MDYRQFPYERELGLRELHALGMSVLDDRDSVSALGDSTAVVERATYFARVSSVDGDRETSQARVEAAHVELKERSRARQATRYGLHGIHEYKGKFNPQVVRALCNIVQPDAQLLIDPFCGSGTALLEGMRLEMDVLGIDRSPMATFLAEAKVGAMATTAKAALAKRLERLASHVAEELDRGQSQVYIADLEAALGQDSVSYLEKWFTDEVFAGLSCALSFLSTQRRSIARQLAFVALSSILRSISLQHPDDLRIRRRSGPYKAPEIAPLFQLATDGILCGLAEMDDWKPYRRQGAVCLGDSADKGLYPTSRHPTDALIVTSPPYATALPYVDTDRLSLVALGLVPARGLMEMERKLAGSREWNRAEQVHWDERRSVNADHLPKRLSDLLSEISAANDGCGAGFRRRAVPSLLYRYFTRMSRTMATWARVLPRDAAAVLIVGRNRTTAGAERIEIPTSELLGEVAGRHGFTVDELLSLEAWPRYGLHSANGVAAEDALILKRS